VDLDESPSTCGFFMTLIRTSVRLEVRRLDLMPQSSSMKLQQIDVKAHTVVAVGVVFSRGQKRMLENDGTGHRASVMRPTAAAGSMGGARGGLQSARDTNDAGRQCSISPPAIGKLPPVAPLTGQSPRTVRIGLCPALWGVTSTLIFVFVRLLACLICLPAQPPGGRHGRRQGPAAHHGPAPAPAETSRNRRGVAGGLGGARHCATMGNTRLRRAERVMR